MKQLLFLLLFPCLALAQYQGNGNQKITLGEQTTADGLVWRGIRADTTSKIVPFSDTSAYIILDTVEKTLWLYKAGQIPKWQQVGGSAGSSTFDTATLNLVSRFALKLNISDTASMLSNYNSRINLKVNISDTTNMLNPYFRDADTTNLNLTTRFAAKQNDIILTTTGTSGAATLSNDTLNIPQYSGGGGSTLDTATMLLPYYRAGRSGIIQVADVPTLNQNTTGSAATLTTARNIRTNLASAYGANFNGSADITPGVSGVLGAGNGGTGASNFGSPNRIPFVSSSGSLTTDTFFAYNGTTQRLGVGVPNPTEKLHVVGNGLFTGSMSLGTPLTGNNGGTGLTTFGAANNIPFASSTTALATDNNFVYNTSTKSFGVGTSNPTRRLHLVNNTVNNVVVTFQNNVTRSSGYSSYAFELFAEGREGSSYAFRAKNLAETKVYMTIQTDSLNQVGGDRTGFVGLGTDAPTQVLHVVGNARITAMNNVSDIGASSTGVLQAASASDINLKNTIENSAFGLNEILLLNPVTFFYNDLDRKLDNDVKDVGFIAQDVFDVIPNAVSSMGDGYLQIDYKAITATLVKAMQEQQALIKALEQRIINLENK